MDRVSETVQDVGHVDTAVMSEHAELTLESNGKFTNPVDISKSREGRIGMESNPEECDRLGVQEKAAENNFATGEGINNNHTSTSNKTYEDLDHPVNGSVKELLSIGFETLNAYTASGERCEHVDHDESLNCVRQIFTDCVNSASERSVEELASQGECLLTEGRSLVAVSSCIPNGADIDNSVIPIDSDNMHCDNVDDVNSIRDDLIGHCLQTHLNVSNENRNLDKDNGECAHGVNHVEEHSLEHILIQDIMNRSLKNVQLASSEYNDENGSKHNVTNFVRMKVSDSVKTQVLCDTDSAIECAAEGFITTKFDLDINSSKMMQLPICDKNDQTDPSTSYTPDVVTVSADGIPELASVKDVTQIDMLEDCADIPNCKLTERGSVMVDCDNVQWTNSSSYKDNCTEDIVSLQDCNDISSIESKLYSGTSEFIKEVDVLNVCHLDPSYVQPVDYCDSSINDDDAQCMSNYQTYAEITRPSSNVLKDDSSTEGNQAYSEDSKPLEELLDEVNGKHSEKVILPEVCDIMMERNSPELHAQEEIISNGAILEETVSGDGYHLMESELYQRISLVENRSRHEDTLIEEQLQDILLGEAELNAGNLTQSDVVEEMKNIREELQTLVDDTQSTEKSGPSKNEDNVEVKPSKKSKSSRKRKKQQQKLAKLLEKHSTQHPERGRQKFALSFIELRRPLYECDDYDVDKSLTCPVCLEMLYLPTACHPCRHTYCDTCLRRLTGQGTQDLPCPLCRTIIQSCTRDSELDEHLMITHPDLYSSRALTERRSKFRCFPLPYTPPEPLGRRFIRHLVASRMNPSETGWMAYSWIKFLLGCTIGACTTLLIMVLNRVKSLQDVRDVNIMFLSLLFGSGLSYLIVKFVLK